MFVDKFLIWPVEKLVRLLRVGGSVHDDCFVFAVMTRFISEGQATSGCSKKIEGKLLSTSDAEKIDVELYPLACWVGRVEGFNIVRRAESDILYESSSPCIFGLILRQRTRVRKRKF